MYVGVSVWLRTERSYEAKGGREGGRVSLFSMHVISFYIFYLFIYLFIYSIYIIGRKRKGERSRLILFISACFLLYMRRNKEERKTEKKKRKEKKNYSK